MKPGIPKTSPGAFMAWMVLAWDISVDLKVGAYLVTEITVI